MLHILLKHSKVLKYIEEMKKIQFLGVAQFVERLVHNMFKIFLSSSYRED